ncbi:hypothetical protein QVD17_21946 [Tagetes erecta]|uniref:Uncharacterized protein n=1 Tax=Tagetes erecta TaxID=13708 RepID=A0AAD8NLH8_TARER|nr:hypothetical protein QVD17_21946 [Tagetes erecta]
MIRRQKKREGHVLARESTRPHGLYTTAARDEENPVGFTNAQLATLILIPLFHIFLAFFSSGVESFHLQNLQIIHHYIIFLNTKFANLRDLLWL